MRREAIPDIAVRVLSVALAGSAHSGASACIPTVIATERGNLGRSGFSVASSPGCKDAEVVLTLDISNCNRYYRKQ